MRAPIVPGFKLRTAMTEQEISDFCVASLAQTLRLPKDRIDTRTKFNRLGLDSAMIVYVMMELEEKLGVELTTDDFYDHPTVEELSRYVAKRRAARPAA
jgi:acyl carrier protein